MKAVFILSIFLAGITGITHGQGRKTWTNVLLSADSVFLISHVITLEGPKQPPPKMDDSVPTVFTPHLLINGSLNNSVVVKKHILMQQERRQLAGILNSRFDKISIIKDCYEPHHSVIIVKNGKTSYMDICFQCLGYRFTADLEDIVTRFEWTRLRKYFLEKKLL
jgi:hypothetical protein